METAHGAVRGRVAQEPDRVAVRVFRGIPYAAPPVGDERFAPPRAPSALRGVLDAGHFGPSAPQPRGGPLEGLVPGMAVGPTSEDCLTLNVWWPQRPGGAKPVMVWFHGGAFTIGGSSQQTYDGARLAADGDVVVVSCNYRLGALGFCALDTPNCGLLDQVAALRWVHENIAAFGGDPGRVTVFGESAGAGCILHLLAAPSARGLFRRAIVQSGATNLTLDAARAAIVATTFAAQLGLAPDDVAGMRSVDAERIVAAQEATAAAVFASVGMMGFHPGVDGEVVTSTPLDAVRSGAADGVELLIGTTRDEMRLFLGPGDLDLDRDRLVRRVARLTGEGSAAALLAAYEETAGHDRSRPGHVWADIVTDAEMTLPAIDIADAHAAGGATTFAYVFTWPAAVADRDLGACHAIDLPFTFASIDREGWDAFVGGGPAADDLSARVRAAWCAFAHEGSPGWAAYEPTRRTTMMLGRVCTPVDDPLGKRRVAWTA